MALGPAKSEPTAYVIDSSAAAASSSSRGADFSRPKRQGEQTSGSESEKRSKRSDDDKDMSWVYELVHPISRKSILKCAKELSRMFGYTEHNDEQPVTTLVNLARKHHFDKDVFKNLLKMQEQKF